MKSQNTRTSSAAAPTRERGAPGVLIALDGSLAAASAIPAAQRLAQQLDMPLHVLYVASNIAKPGRAIELDLEPSLLALPGVELEVRVGDPAAEILRAIEAPDTYLTVLTTHGRVIEHGRHLGHVAEQVITQTMRPILLIRPESAATASTAIEARRFLLPLDGKAATARALGRVADIVQRLGGSFDVLFVADPKQLAPDAAARTGEPGSLAIPRYVDQLQHEWPAWMREALDHLSACSARYPLGVSARVHVAGVAGVADETIAGVILQFVAQHQQDVIVLVRRSQLESGRAVILRALLDQTPCPVLLSGAPTATRTHVKGAAATT